MKFRKKRADEGEGLEENRCIPKNGNVVQVGVDAERREAALNVEENGMLREGKEEAGKRITLTDSF